MKNKTTKADVVNHIAGFSMCGTCVNGGKKKAIGNTVDRMFSFLRDSLMRGSTIEIRDFGVFSMKDTRPRIARNPKTGESLKIQARKRVIFKPGKELREFCKANL